MEVKLTQYSHGAGCGCKISPQVLNQILETQVQFAPDPRLLVGNSSRDDAAVYALDNDQVVISTTDFFMPIVDDPYDFGGIASVNAISDVYAMGGKPIMAIAILGWPINVLPPEVAQKVLEGARAACARAGIPLAGGHSIDAPEPIFGLAVTGTATRDQIRTNNAAQAGNELYLTKPLGVGILSTAQKKGKLRSEDSRIAPELMLTLNDIGQAFAQLKGVKAMTDVTGFGLLGHLIEMADGSALTAEIEFSKVPRIGVLDYYMELGTFPGGTQRNFDSYGARVAPVSDSQRNLLCDPQTSGGLLVAVDPAEREAFLAVAAAKGLALECFGKLKSPGEFAVVVKD